MTAYVATTALFPLFDESYKPAELLTKKDVIITCDDSMKLTQGAIKSIDKKESQKLYKLTTIDKTLTAPAKFIVCRKVKDACEYVYITQLKIKDKVYIYYNFKIIETTVIGIQELEDTIDTYEIDVDPASLFIVCDFVTALNVTS